MTASLAHSSIARKADALLAPRQRAPSTPNVLVLVSDDQAPTNFTRDLMPNVFTELVDRGVDFTRGYDVTSLCCPARAEILTGLYEHHTGVDDNPTPLTRPTLVQALHDVGYHTSLAGKYLNSWPCTPRPEFDQWICAGSGKSDYRLKNPTLNVNGVWTKFSGYQTDILANYTVDFIDSTPPDQPFFALYTPTTPHLPADDDRCSTIPVDPFRPPSYDEDTQNDAKPAYLSRPPLSPAEQTWIDTDHQLMTRAVPCLDSSLGLILSALDAKPDVEQNTLVFYLTDNGFFFGEHRRRQKMLLYEESSHTPFVVRYPPLVPEATPFTTDALVENVDIAPTIADLVGIHWGVDGTSLRPILDGSLQSVRDAALLEGCEGTHHPCMATITPFGFSLPPSMEGVVTPEFKYIELVTGEQEMYDLIQDPYELTNLAGDPGYAQEQSQLADDLAALTAPPPTDTTIVTGPQGELAARVATFTYFSQSRLATYQCRLDVDGQDGSWAPCDLGSVTVGPMADGNYTFEVEATDENGVTDATPDARPFSVASTGPDVSIDSAPDPHTKDNTLTFTFSSQSPDVTFQCQLALLETKGQWSPCTPPGVTYGPLADGQWLFQVQATDGSGSTSDPPAEALVNVDRSGPRMIFSSSSAGKTRSTTATFTFQPDEAILGSAQCRLDGGKWITCDRSFDAVGLAEGPHTLRVRATDVLGTKGTTRVTWVVDLTPPILTLGGPPSYSNDPNPSFSISANEKLFSFAPYSCALDGENLVSGIYLASSCQAPQTRLPGLPDGIHTLQVAATDLAGNTSLIAAWTWTVDTIAPVTSVTSGPSDPTTDTTAVFQFSAVDASPVTFACSLDGEPSSPCVSGVTYEGLAPGGHSFVVVGTDAAGNSGPPAEWDWQITP